MTTPPAPLPRESVRALAAFEAYWALGDARTVTDAARSSGLAHSVVRRYAVKFDWDTRVRARIAEQSAAERASHAAADQQREQALVAYERHLLTEGRQLFDEAIRLVRKQIKTGKVTTPALLALQEARAITLRGLRQAATITRTEQTGVGGGPLQQQQEVLIRQYVGVDIAVATGETSAASVPTVGGSQDALPHTGT